MSRKVTVIGAGSVGSTITYTMAVNGLASEIVLIDINKEKAKGEAMDIQQGTPFCSPIKVYAGDYEDAEGSDIVIITSGMPRKANQTRLDLTQINVNIIKTIAKEITKYAPDALYVIVIVVEGVKELLVDKHIGIFAYLNVIRDRICRAVYLYTV